MALTTKDIIQMRTPQFYGDSRLDKFIELATMLTSTTFGVKRDYAIALRVMHLLTLESIRNALSVTSSTNSGIAMSGLVSAEAEGDLSRSYVHSSTSLPAGNAERWGDLNKTEYGLELIELITSSLFMPRTRMMDAV